MSNDYNDNNGNARVTFRPDFGSINETPKDVANEGQPVLGGLYSGGQAVSERGEDASVRVVCGPPDLGGFTARTQDGIPITSTADLQPNSRVTLPDGTETDYEVAKMAGLLTTEAILQMQQDQTPDQREEKTPEKQTEPMDAQAEAVMREVIGKSEGAAIGAMLDVLQNDGVLSTQTVEELASVLQVEPRVVLARADVAIRGYAEDAYRGSARAAQTDDALAAEALHDARECRRSEFDEAAREHFFTGVTKHYAPLVRDYLSGLAATDPTRVLAAETGSGIAVSQDSQGEILLSIPGIGTMRYEDAVAGGHVVVTSGRKRR